MNLYHGDCLEVLPTFPPASVEAIITDLPYGTTACEWDSIIPLAPMWEQVKRVLKVNGAFITTASQPFTSILIVSNLEWFRDEWIWEKDRATRHLDAERRPLKAHESIIVFGKVLPQYNPQKTSGHKPANKNGKNGKSSPVYHKYETIVKGGNTDRFPRSVQYFHTANSAHGIYHSTQKPVSLYEYLVRTYTNAGETVLDICMGSGTTGVAAVQTGRNFIGIEKEQRYFEIASRRIAQAPQPLFTEPPRQPTQRAADGGNVAPQNELFG